MKYFELVEFIEKKMRMSHIYQPVMLMELLDHGGICKDSEIVRALLSRDQSQIDYYTEVTNNMVGKVLLRRSVVTRDKSTREYALLDFDSLTVDQISDLKSRCVKRLLDYVEKRGDSIFAHRKKSVGYISGTLRYEILKRSKFRCELCGISAEEKALEVDHILPRNHGGSDDLSNLQALCYSCNAMKRDRDDTDFRSVRSSYEIRSAGCVFCEPEVCRVLAENELAYLYLDGFPVTGGHALVIPKRHVSSYFELGGAEINACTSLIVGRKLQITESDPRVDGFNLGVNVGNSAGQTVMHCHIHVIPRRTGDMEDPTGGVRHVIPGKGNYQK